MDAERLAALSERNRLRIIELLAQAPRPVGEIASALGVRQPQVTKHLQTLEQAGLVRAHALGRRRIYSLRRGPLHELAAWATRMAAPDPNDDALQRYQEAISVEEQRLAAGLAPRPVRLRRRVSAPPQRVWAAWTRATALRQWWAPEHFRVASCRVNVRPGGRATLVLAEGDGRQHRATGVFHVVDEPHRLVFDLSPVDPDGRPLFRLVHTVTLQPGPGGTQVSVRLQPHDPRPGAAPALAGVRPGWQQALDRLVAYCSEAQSAR